MTRLVAFMGGIFFSAMCLAQSMQQELMAFEPFVGHTYRGQFSPDKDGHMAEDISRWERILGGRAIRISHTLNRGDYAGESLIFWDAKAQSIAFFYVTNAGFHTRGTGHFEDGVFVTREEVTGNQQGITEVVARSTLHEDGSMTVSSYYLKGDEKINGSTAHYVRDNEAVLVFSD